MRIIIDDAADIPQHLIEAYDIYVVPINIIFGADQFLSGVTMTHAEFYDKIEVINDAAFPKTSQPSPFQFEEAYRALLAVGETEFLTITVSDRLSGTYASADAAARALAGRGRFHLFDSQSGSAAQGLMALEAARLLREGASIEAIMARLEQMRSEIVIIFTIDSLEFARRGGRVSNVKSVMASLLNIKPIVTVRDGIIVEAGRARTRRKAVTRIVADVAKRVGDRPARLAVVHANCEAEAEQLARQAETMLAKQGETLVTDMAISVAVNLGPGALGLIAIPE